MAMILYNENKVSKGTAERLFSHKFLVDHPQVYRDTFTHMVSGSKKGNPTFHASLSFADGDILSPEAMERVASTYMERMGYGEQPYVVYRHDDTHHAHVHIISVNIDENNKRISEWNDQYKSQRISREIEAEFKLSPVSSIKSRVEEGQYAPGNFKSKVAKASMNLKQSMHLQDFRQVQQYFGTWDIEVVKIEAEGRKKEGYVFRSLSDIEQKPIKASHLYHEFNAAVLDKIYERAKGVKDKFVKEKLVSAIKGVFAKPKTMEMVEAALAKIQVKVLFDRYQDGRIYGMSFLDMKSGLMFKASELHRDLSYQKVKDFIVEQLPEEVYSSAALKEMVAKVSNRLIGERASQMWQHSGIISSRSEVLKSFSGEDYRVLLENDGELATLLSGHQSEELNSLIAKRIKWLCSSAIIMAEAGETMQAHIQSKMRKLSAQSGADEGNLLAEVEKILADVPGAFSEDILLKNNEALQRIYAQGDHFAWDLALKGTHAYTQKILTERAAALYCAGMKDKPLDALLALAQEQVNDGHKAFYTVEDLSLSERGVELTKELDAYLSSYSKDQANRAGLIEKILINKINETEVKSSLKRLTVEHMAEIPERQQADEYLKMAENPGLFFSEAKVINPTLKHLYEEYKQAHDLPKTLRNYIKSHAEVLVHKGASRYLSAAVQALKAEQKMAGIRQKESEFVLGLSATRLKETESGKVLIEKLEPIYRAQGRGAEDIQLRIDGVFNQAVSYRQSQLPDIQMNECLRESFEAAYLQAMAQTKHLPDVQSFMATKEASKLYQKALAIFNSYNIKDAGAQVKLALVNRLIERSILQTYKPYLNQVEAINEERSKAASMLLLSESMKIRKSTGSQTLQRFPLLAEIDKSIKEEDLKLKIEKVNTRVSEQVLKQSFNLAFWDAYHSDLENSKLKESEYLNSFNVQERLLLGINLTPYLMHFKETLSLNGFAIEDIDKQINNMALECIHSKMIFINQNVEQENFKLEGKILSSMFSAKSVLNWGLNDKKNNGRKI